MLLAMSYCAKSLHFYKREFVLMTHWLVWEVMNLLFYLLNVPSLKQLKLRKNSKT